MRFRSPLKKPDVETLRDDDGYDLILELDFNDMIPFVLKNIKRKSALSILYAGINLAMFSFIAFCLINGIKSESMVWGPVLRQVLTGIVAGTILIIPVHELLHGLVYRLLGAKKIRFGTDLQQFIFFVTADRFPVSGREIIYLALTPFMVINIITIFIIVTWFPHLMLFSLFFLLSHNMMCIGDFAIVNYVMQEKRRIYNYDVVDERKSYFYQVLF
jgi:hypothetical protein